MAHIATSSPIGRDLNDIVQKDYYYKPYFLHSTILHTTEKDLNENDGLIIENLIIHRDYIEGTGDYIEITLFCKLGTYIYDIYPYAEDLELSLTRYKQTRGGDGLETLSFTCRYKALFLLDKNIDIPTNSLVPRETLDRQGYVSLKFQLVDYPVYALRNTTVQGSYSDRLSEGQDMSYKTLVKSILNGAIDTMAIDSRKPIDKINIEEPDNQEKIGTIVIPTGTPLFDLPTFIHEKGGGIYTGGIGTYVQHYSRKVGGDVDRVLFVYSLFRANKFAKEDNKVMFFVSPDKSWNIVDSTYKYRYNVLKVMTFPVEGMSSTKETVYRDEGEGFRTADADAVIDAPLEFTEDGPKYRFRDWLTEISDKEQPDGLNNVPYKGISNNHFVNASDILSRKGEYIILQAENVDPDYYYPGAPCQITMQLGNAMIRELYGIIHKVTVKFEYSEFNMNAELNRLRHGLTAMTYFTVYITDF